MTDEEMISFYEHNAALHNGLGLDRLIVLARIGAAVKPRPISEAPKDGRRILAYSPNWSDWMTVQIYGDNWRASFEQPKLKYQPTHFIPLSALPPPPEQQEPK